MGEQSVQQLDLGISEIARRSREDRAKHDFSLLFKESRYGVTFHCSYDELAVASDKLQRHCEIAKYREKTDRWLGVLVSPQTGDAKQIITSNYSWHHDPEMEEMVRKLPKPNYQRRLVKRTRGARKVGRNDPCPCEANANTNCAVSPEQLATS